VKRRNGPTIDVEAFKVRAWVTRRRTGYDTATAAVTSQVNQAVLDAVTAGPGTSLLDVACGPGWLSAAAAQRGAVVSALDFAENMVLLARSRCPEADVHIADAESLPFEPDRFNAVVCSFGILHLPNPEHAVSEAYRVIGRAVASLHCWLPRTAILA
jgi:ubiquinone/menaquinone biosynthesis C-methylase UbiE